MIRLLFTSLATSAAVALPAAAQTSSVRGQDAIRAAELAAPTIPSSRKEIGDSMGYLHGGMLTLFDDNGDGRLSPDEWLESHYAPFLVFSERRDGRLTFQDFVRALNGPPGLPLRNLSRGQLEKQFKRLDRGRKGYLTIDDFREEAAKTFRLNNVNRDGFVTPQEVNYVARGPRRRG